MKKKFVTIFSVFTLVIVLAITLTSCLKVGMQKNNIKKRLDEAGVSYTYERTTPITKDGERDYPFEDLMHCTKSYTTTVDGVETEVVQELYIIFAGSDEAAEWAKEKADAYVADNSLDKWNSYIYDRVIMCGYYELLTIARSY